MQQEQSPVLFDKSWLNQLNTKRQLIDRAYELKAGMSRDIFLDALRIHEAEDKYLNRLPSGELEKLVKDLERLGN